MSSNPTKRERESSIGVAGTLLADSLVHRDSRERERERKGQQWIKLEESKDEEGLEEVEGLSREATSDQVKSLDLRAWCPPRFPVSRVSPLLFHLSPILSSRR